MMWTVGAATAAKACEIAGPEDVSGAGAVRHEIADSVNNESVARRTRPEYRQEPRRVGGFCTVSRAEAALLYSDNVFSVNEGQGDMAMKTLAEVDMVSDRSQHFLALHFDIEDSRYHKFGERDQTNFSGQVKGGFEISEGTEITGVLSYSQKHDEGRDIPGRLPSFGPVPWSTTLTMLQGRQKAGDAIFELSGSFAHVDYDAGAIQAGSGGNPDFRDHTIYKSGLRASYSFSPALSAFGMIAVNLRDVESAAGLPDRDSRGMEARIGLEYEITRIVAARISGGILHQDYRSSQLSDVDDFAFQAALVWNPTRVMTINLEASRTVSETSVAGTYGRIDSGVGFGMDYEILHNLLGSVKFEYLEGLYTGTDRRDETLSGGVALEYLISRNFSARAYYSFEQRNSSLRALDYESNIFGSALKIGF